MKRLPMLYAIGAYVAVCSILWVIPLLQILHAESSAVIAFFSFFIAGLSALHQRARAVPFSRILVEQWILLVVPLGLLTFSMLWQMNCDYGRGLLFFLLFPGITVVFAVCLASALHTTPIRNKKGLLVGAGLLMSIAGPLYDIGFHPQFYTYNHVFGGVMGPIYDEEIHIRGGLVAFRSLTLLWACLCWLYAVRRHRNRYRLAWYSGWLCVVLLIGCSYLFSASLRINTPDWFIQDQLGAKAVTEHFVIYYDSTSINDTHLRMLIDEHEFRYERYQETLGIEVEERIASYIYPNPDVKDWLTGSSTTSVAPVWLSSPQMHIYVNLFDRVFAHELAHVFSREFGLPVLNASLSVGLVEGFAVALEPSDGRPMPHEQIAIAYGINNAGAKTSSPAIADRLKAQLSPVGFWTGRGAVSYTTMGSFVGFLMDQYGPRRFMDVYTNGDFERIYGKAVDTLVDEWVLYLSELPFLSRAANDYVTRRFAMPSLFEQPCPHHVPSFVQRYREAEAALTVSDTTLALALFDEALDIEPGFQNAMSGWAQLMLMKASPDSVVSRITAMNNDATTAYMTPVLWVRLGDAYALQENQLQAVEAYDQASNGLPLYEHEQHGLLEVRRRLVRIPSLLKVLTSARSTDEKVERIGQLGVDHEEIVSLLQGLLLAADEDYTNAIRLLEATRFDGESVPQAGDDTLNRLVDIATIDVYYRAMLYDKAHDKAQNLQTHFLQIGAFPEAAFYADFAQKMQYISQMN